MDAFPKHYEYPSIPDLTLNAFREKLPIEQAMQLDTLIRGQLIREIATMNYRDKTTRKLFTGTLRERDLPHVSERLHNGDLSHAITGRKVSQAGQLLQYYPYSK